jgi:Pyridine nucleotide-disulphide oxidoreductase, dimerisation domain
VIIGADAAGMSAAHQALRGSLAAARSSRSARTPTNKAGLWARASPAVTCGGVLGTAITRFGAAGTHVEIARTGLDPAEAADAGFNAAGLATEGRTASGYTPEASPMATKVLADKASRQLLGVQIVGGHGAGKPIDITAAAPWAASSIDDLAGMDLAYAPPFATVWEAVQLAARRRCRQ